MGTVPRFGSRILNIFSKLLTHSLAQDSTYLKACMMYELEMLKFHILYFGPSKVPPLAARARISIYV